MRRPGALFAVGAADGDLHPVVARGPRLSLTEVWAGQVQKRVTIVEVAEKAGVAISSVSSALNNRPGVSEQTRKRILAVADELGFVRSLHGRSLSSKKAFAVGLVVQRDPEVLESDPFFAGFIGGVESVLVDRGYALVLQMATSGEEVTDRYRQLVLNNRVDGVFLSEIEVDDPRIALLEELQLPTVGVNADLPGFPFPVVRQDHARGFADLIHHLMGLGHRRIAHLAGPRRFLHAQQREATWRNVLESAGLAAAPIFEGDFTYESGVNAAEAVRDSATRPTAIVCANDLMAIGFIARATDLGLRVPEQISVAGFDGIQLGAYLRPTLTTVTTSPRTLGAEGAQMLLTRIDGSDVSDRHIADAELSVRQSTGPAPAHRA